MGVLCCFFLSAVAVLLLLLHHLLPNPFETSHLLRVSSLLCHQCWVPVLPWLPVVSVKHPTGTINQLFVPPPPPPPPLLRPIFFVAICIVFVFSFSFSFSRILQKLGAEICCLFCPRARVFDWL